MKRRMAVLVLTICALCAALATVGCDKYEPESTEADAIAYYQEKYGEKVGVQDAHGLGNYALFGYSYVGMEYVMDDGVSVIYIDDEGMFCDNRQTTDIEAAYKPFTEEKLAALPGLIVAPTLQWVGDDRYYQTYEGHGMCWHTRFDGDIEEFLRSELPPLELETHASGDQWGDGRFSYELACDYAVAQEVEDALLALSSYFDMRGVRLAVVDPQAFDAGESSLFDEAVYDTVSFKGSSASDIQVVHHKPVFVKLMDGATVSSATPGVVLAEGDVSFTPAEDGFYRCHVKGEAAAYGGEMEYYVHNDSDIGIVQVRGLDSFLVVCDPRQHIGYRKFVDGGIYFLGVPQDIAPWIDVEKIENGKVHVRFHTHFKDKIHRVELRVIGMAMSENSGSWVSTGFKSRIVEETDDGYRCIVYLPERPKPDNTLHFQFTYNDDEDISLQMEKAVQLD